MLDSLQTQSVEAGIHNEDKIPSQQGKIRESEVIFLLWLLVLLGDEGCV